MPDVAISWACRRPRHGAAARGRHVRRPPRRQRASAPARRAGPRALARYLDFPDIERPPGPRLMVVARLVARVRRGRRLAPAMGVDRPPGAGSDVRRAAKPRRSPAQAVDARRRERGGRRAGDANARCRTAMPSAMIEPWITNWTDAGAPMPSTTCSSWVRKSAPTPVATTLPTPPASDVPPSTTAAIVGSR